jgi:protein-L-isoaspartate(D-aspartate) O-methyltransferase
MISFAQARRMMIDGQIRTSDVTDLALLAAMQDVPRDRFVPGDKIALAYSDLNVPVSEESDGRPRRFLLRPIVLAKLIQAAEITDADHVLDVGCATGYGPALLARLAARVTALEEDRDLAERASSILAELGANNVTVTKGPLTEGWPSQAPYDVILVEGAAEVVPQSLFSQLSDGGRLVCVQGNWQIGKGMVYRSAGGDVSGRPVFDAVAPVLPGFVKPPAFVF